MEIENCITSNEQNSGVLLLLSHSSHKNISHRAQLPLPDDEDGDQEDGDGDGDEDDVFLRMVMVIRVKSAAPFQRGY